jgi:hypothetical protein
MIVIDRLIDRAGELNPQLFRELKERLTLRNIITAISSALVIQGLILFYFNGQIPVPAYEYYHLSSSRKLVEIHSKYCEFSINNHYNYNYQDQLCKLNSVGDYTINWQEWWADVFIGASWMLPMGLMLGSVYMLVADLVQEEKRGTLNFIRLSPQSARTIFIGKISGVPILVYLAVALAIPLHLLSGLNAGADLALLAGWYLAIGSLWFLLSSSAILYVLLGGIQAILTIITVAYPICLPLFAINTFAAATINQEDWLIVRGGENISWFGLPVFGSAIGMYVFTIACFCAASYWVWEALERRYLNPTATMISKTQSYLINLSLQLSVAGFVIPLVSKSLYNKAGIMSGLATIDFMALALLIPMLLPSKQALQDWSRYRRERVTHQPRKFWQRELVQDLLFSDKSPTLLAIAINIGMALVLWIPISIVAFANFDRGTIGFIGSACFATSLILIYAAIAHLVLFLNVKKRNLWMMGILGALITLPLGVAYILSPTHSPTGWAGLILLFSPFAPVSIMSFGGTTLLATFATQLTMLGILTRQLQRKLQISGQSQSKELLARG